MTKRNYANETLERLRQIAEEQTNHYQLSIFGIKSRLDIDELHKLIIEQLTYMRRKDIIQNKESAIELYNLETKKHYKGIESN